MQKVEITSILITGNQMAHLVESARRLSNAISRARDTSTIKVVVADGSLESTESNSARSLALDYGFEYLRTDPGSLSVRLNGVVRLIETEWVHLCLSGDGVDIDFFDEFARLAGRI